jgi:anti-sigma regulatory factor (Ser/Thr protein kinase)
MELKIPYYIEYTNLVASFMEEIGRSHGANSEELMQLRLIGEEAFVFILNGIPKVGIQNSFHLHCNEDQDGLTFYFSNHGRPMNARKIPEFDTEKANETADALSLNIIKCFSYEFSYQNNGKEGWELLIRFHIKDYKQLTILNFHENDFDEVKQEAYTVRRATEADVPGIINLVYNTYRYSYAKEVFYNDIKLAKMIRENRILSIITETESGQIVGHNAVLLDSPFLGEAGMAMVDPNYRKSKVFLSMALFTVREIKNLYPKILGYAKCVTSHRRSQAFVANFTSSLLQLSVYNHASFVGIKGDANPRETLIYSILNFSNDKTEKTIYVPQEHQAFIQQLLTNAKFNITVLPYDENQEEPENSVLHYETLPGRQFAEITMEQSGQDFDSVLQKQTNYLRQNGIMTINLLLPTSSSLNPEINSHLLKNGYFFSGFKPTPDGSWNIVYCNLLSQIFDFNKLQLFSEESKQLSEYIQTEYKKITE